MSDRKTLAERVISAVAELHEDDGPGLFSVTADELKAIIIEQQAADAEQEALALKALRLHIEYEAVRQDRGGDRGPKGQAHAAWIAARDAALAATPER